MLEEMIIGEGCRVEINNVRIYGLEESIIASGYPMQVDTEDDFFDMVRISCNRLF